MNISIWLLWIILLCVGVFVAEVVTGRPEGPISSLTDYPNQKWPSLFVGIGVSKIQTAYHIHHWMWSFLLVWIFYFVGLESLAALCSGICLQGLTYEDRFKIKVDMEG
jgi:hypothetical protein